MPVIPVTGEAQEGRSLSRPAGENTRPYSKTTKIKRARKVVQV
jgi:hypothetical protein